MQLSVNSEVQKTKEEIIHCHERISNTQGADNTKIHDHILRLKTHLVTLMIFKNLPDIRRQELTDFVLMDLPEKTSE